MCLARSSHVSISSLPRERSSPTHRPMSKQAWKDKLSLAQETTNRATRQELARDYSSAYETYVRAGDLYLWLVKNREPTSEATELRERLRRVLGRAEAIKLAGRSARIVERRLLSDGGYHGSP